MNRLLNLISAGVDVMIWKFLKPFTQAIAKSKIWKNLFGRNQLNHATDSPDSTLKIGPSKSSPQLEKKRDTIKMSASDWSFYEAVKIILKFEGGYVNDPNDPGGETNWGISKRAFPHVDIKNLSKQDAELIYKKNYWEPMKCEKYPAILRLAAFDCAVNQGVLYASTTLQKLLFVPVDGIIGPVTLNKMGEVSANELLLSFLKARAERYIYTKNFELYGRGWLNRLIEILYYSRGLDGNH